MKKNSKIKEIQSIVLECYQKGYVKGKRETNLWGYALVSSHRHRNSNHLQQLTKTFHFGCLPNASEQSEEKENIEKMLKFQRKNATLAVVELYF